MGGGFLCVLGGGGRKSLTSRIFGLVVVVGMAWFLGLDKYYPWMKQNSVISIERSHVKVFYPCILWRMGLQMDIFFSSFFFSSSFTPVLIKIKLCTTPLFNDYEFFTHPLMEHGSSDRHFLLLLLLSLPFRLVTLFIIHPFLPPR